MSEHIQQQLSQLNQQVKEIAAVYHGAANKLGVSHNEFWVWYALLILKGEYTQQDISVTLCLPKQTVNTIISGMVKKGYLVLEADPENRNRKLIRLTEEGQVYGSKLVDGVYKAEQRSLSRMSEEERQMCVNLLSEYIGILKEEVLGN